MTENFEARKKEIQAGISRRLRVSTVISILPLMYIIGTLIVYSGFIDLKEENLILNIILIQLILLSVILGHIFFTNFLLQIGIKNRLNRNVYFISKLKKIINKNLFFALIFVLLLTYVTNYLNTLKNILGTSLSQILFLCFLIYAFRRNQKIKVVIEKETRDVLSIDDLENQLDNCAYIDLYSVCLWMIPISSCVMMIRK